MTTSQSPPSLSLPSTNPSPECGHDGIALKRPGMQRWPHGAGQDGRWFAWSGQSPRLGHVCRDRGGNSQLMHAGRFMEKVTHQLRRAELIDAVVIGEACGVLWARMHLTHPHQSHHHSTHPSKGLPNQNQELQNPTPRRALTWTRQIRPLRSPAGKP